MKKIALLFLLSIFVATLNAQNDKNKMIGAHSSLGVGSFGLLGSKGGRNYETKYYYTAGLDYSRAISARWDFCSGIECTFNNMTYYPLTPGQKINEKYPANLLLITLPAQFKYHAGKILFLNGGPFINVLSRVKESGGDRYDANMQLGLGLGIGLEHEFAFGLVLSLNPYTRWNGIFNGFKYLQAGVSLGVGYKF
ncbi:MAG: hypothetical protein LBC84_01535 [Prevotellaceae bacterium]|jgi:hypothetical protein|nr:hypothetical protein [Prevotellaceae bacterium]